MRLRLPILFATTLAGFYVFAADAPQRSPGLENIFQWLDKDGDGKITREEAGNPEWFSRLDRNGDGVITPDELRTVAGRLGGARAGGIVGGFQSLPGQPESSPSTAAEESPRQGPKAVKPADAGVGRLVPDVKFTDIHGKTGKLSDFKSARALVIAFTSTSCPVTKKYAPSLARLEKEFAAKGVKFLFVNPIASDAPAGLRADIKEHGFTGPYIHDKNGVLARALGAQTTAEMFVLDAARTLVFRGAVDDQYGLGYALDAPRRNYLKDALVAVLAGQAPRIAATLAPGCALDVKPAATLTKDINYHNRISRILQQNCLECHHAGGVAPFSLETYEDVKSHAGMMSKQVNRAAMPPWFAAPTPDGAHTPWINDRSLAAQDKADLLAWLASDKPVGKPADAPLARVFPTDWQIGKPDLVVQLPRAVPIKAEGVMPYQFLTVETTLSEDKWVQAFEVRPTAREVVHHVIIKVREKGTILPAGRGGEGADEREGFFAAYVPGNSYSIFREGFAKKLAAGATVIFQIHYTPNGQATTDRLQLGLVFAKEPPRHTLHVAGIANPLLRIPPGAPDHREMASVTLPYDTTVLGFMPHMHLRGKAARYEATLPDGTKKLLLDVPRYDFNWQLQYQLAEPLTLPRGTTITFSAWFDNSANNPANPDPSKLVHWGPQTYDEMHLGYIEYYVANTEFTRGNPQTPRTGADE